MHPASTNPVSQPSQTRTPRFCSILAQAQNLDPVGRATPCDAYLALEQPLPWPYDILEAKTLPPALATLLAQRREEMGRKLRVLLLAPDSQHSRTGYRRLLYFRRAAPPYAGLERQEYLVPEAALTELVAVLLDNPEAPATFRRYRQPDDGLRDLLVCTHGTVDAACGKFGYPTYHLLRSQYATSHLRIWRCSHFGGHICAPTLLTFPDGRAWAFIGPEQAAPLVRRTGDPHSLYRHYRGWSLLDHPLAQVLERDVWMHEGWSWLEAHAEAEVVAWDGEDEEHPRWAEVCLRYRTVDGRSGVYAGRVECYRRIETIAATDSSESYVYPQYRVTRLAHTPTPAVELEGSLLHEAPTGRASLALL